jgi:hypothetical protein
MLSLMFVAQVNSGTRTASGEQVRAALRELGQSAALVIPAIVGEADRAAGALEFDFSQGWNI